MARVQILLIFFCTTSVTAQITDLKVQRLAAPTVTLSSAHVTGGTPVQAQVTLPEPASKEGVKMLLSSTHPSATVPTTVAILPRSASAQFTIQSSAVASDTPVIISAQIAPTGLTGKATLTVLAPRVSGLSITPQAISAGSSATATVVLNGPAPPAGIQVALSSSDPTVATLPQALAVPAGSNSAPAQVIPKVVSSPAEVTVSAGLGNSSKSATIKVLLSVVSVDFPGYSPTATPFNPQLGKLTLSGPAPAEGVQVNVRVLFQGNLPVSSPCFPPPGVASPVTVSPGANSAEFSIATQPSLQRQYALSTLYGGATRAKLFNAYHSPPRVELPATIKGGSSAVGKLVKQGIGTPSQGCGYFLFHLGDDSPLLTVPAQVAFPGGGTEAIFAINTTPVESNQTVTIGARGEFVATDNASYSFAMGQQGAPVGTITVTP